MKKPFNLDIAKELVQGYIGELDLPFLNEILRTKLRECKQHVNLAVKGLLEEIEKNRIKRCYHQANLCRPVEKALNRPCSTCEAYFDCIKLIRKWFPDFSEKDEAQMQKMRE